MHTKTHIPFDTDYTTLLGQAVYSFAYYEWTIISIIEHLDKGFVHEYSRGNPLTSGKVCEELKKFCSHDQLANTAIDEIYNSFKLLTDKRNALIHAHPCTAADGSQVLNYQTKVNKQLHDLLWSIDEIERFVGAVDEAELEAAEYFDSIRDRKADNLPSEI